MIKKISIKNYKSIVDDEIELGRVNVFIGANGAGKSNILEAVAMFSAAKGFDLSVEGLYNKGVRVTKPNLMFSSFLGKRQLNSINISIDSNEAEIFSSKIVADSPDNIYSKWIDEEMIRILEKAPEVSEIHNEVLKAVSKNPDSLSKKDLVGIVKTLESQRSKSIFVNKFITSFTSKYPDTIFQELDSSHLLVKIQNYQIYALSTLALRGITQTSYKQPLGLNGEGLDTLLSTFNDEEWQLLMDYSHFISWLEKPLIDEKDILKFEGHKLGRSTSRLYFVDQFMRKNNNIFAAENANEGALYVLFYLALFISKKTPSFFAIDNIETALNPKICRALMKAISELAEITGKQVLITTHNPAVLDGINLTEQRLFVVNRTDEGHTKTKRIEFKPQNGKSKHKLSELWMRGVLGGLPQNFL